MSLADGCLLFMVPPNRLDSLVQSQARELSQLRQQVKESRRLGVLQRRQVEELGKAFRELLQASKTDCYMGGVVKEQLDRSLSILDRLEGRLDKGSCSTAGSECPPRKSVHENLHSQNTKKEMLVVLMFVLGPVSAQNIFHHWKVQFPRSSSYYIDDYKRNMGKDFLINMGL